MSWINEKPLPWYCSLCLKLIKCGQVPAHIAFIMDGNRRYARKANVDKIDGHSKGFDKLSETLQWCLDLGVTEVTVYAFSIENFKRSEDEVTALMDIARKKFQRLLDEKGKLIERNVQVRVIGNKSKLPADLQELMAKAELINSGGVNPTKLNVAFPYTAQDEITYAANVVLDGLVKGELGEDDVTRELLNQCLYTQGSPPPDLIIRTSGETRLSDFLLWQGSTSHLHFTGVLWPELTLWDFMWAIVDYQKTKPQLKSATKSLLKSQTLSSRANQFIENEKDLRRVALEQSARS